LIDDGYIKFNDLLTREEPPESIFINKLNQWRSTLHKIGLLGQSDAGIGYGNVSRRFKNNSFIISGSATGNQAVLTNREYVLVTDFNIKSNTTESSGLISPSSESMTHGIIYRTLPETKYVMHVHYGHFWDKYKNILPTSAEHIAYGTPEMALEVKRLILSISAHKAHILIMGGHAEGIIAYGSSVDEVGNRLLELVSQPSTEE